MINEMEYQEYFGITTPPKNLKRLEEIALIELRSIMPNGIPEKSDILFGEFKKALMEQMNYSDINSDLYVESGTTGYSLGSYSENASFNTKDNSKSISRISPLAYDKLIYCGLIYSGMGWC